MLSLIDDSVLLCSAITVAEIYAGMKEQERGRTEDLIESLTVINVDREIAEKAGTYKMNIKSQSLELDDCIIAATAAVRKAALATGNEKHYPMSDIVKIPVSNPSSIPGTKKPPGESRGA